MSIVSRDNMRNTFYSKHYIRRRKATPVKNPENVQVAERKEDQNAAIMSYTTLNDSTHNTMYENVPEDGFY